MWSRFGSATGRFESGTEEEFTRAFRRFKEDANSVHLMLYFKDAPIPKKDIDPLQFRRVVEFQSSVSPMGGLSCQFRDLNQFSQFVRIHLCKEIQVWHSRLQEAQYSRIKRKRLTTKEETSGSQKRNITHLQHVAHQNIEDANAAFMEANAAMDRLDHARRIFGERLERDIRGLIKIVKKPITTAKATNALLARVNGVEHHIEEFSRIVAVEGPTYRRSVAKSVELLTMIFTLPVTSVKEGGKESLAPALSAVQDMLAGEAAREKHAEEGIRLFTNLSDLIPLSSEPQQRLLRALSELRQEHAAVQCILRDLQDAMRQISTTAGQ